MSEEIVERRDKTARFLCERDGWDWDTLTDVYQRAYLHNADCYIAEMDAKAAALLPAVVEEPTIETPVTDFTHDEEEALTTMPLEHEGEPESQDSYLSSVPGGDETPKPVEIKVGQYFCSKCNKPHKLDSKIGERHHQKHGIFIA